MIKDLREKQALDLFNAAYDNRYTWQPDFPGYKGRCLWSDGDRSIQGTFCVGSDLKASVFSVEDEAIEKLITSQLWEVAIHRVKRSFSTVHSENTFSYGDENDVGKEILVNGKGKGDRYRIKNNVITMVYRHIHGSLVQIYTNKIIETGLGYLSKLYTSQYLDPITGKAIKPLSRFNDEYSSLNTDGPWLLTKRIIETTHDNTKTNHLFTFSDLQISSN